MSNPKIIRKRRVLGSGEDPKNFTYGDLILGNCNTLYDSYGIDIFDKEFIMSNVRDLSDSSYERVIQFLMNKDKLCMYTREAEIFNNKLVSLKNRIFKERKKAGSKDNKKELEALKNSSRRILDKMQKSVSNIIFSDREVILKMIQELSEGFENIKEGYSRDEE